MVWEVVEANYKIVLGSTVAFFALEYLIFYFCVLFVPRFILFSLEKQNEISVRICSVFHYVFSFLIIPGFFYPSWENHLVQSPPFTTLLSSLGVLDPPRDLSELSGFGLPEVSSLSGGEELVGSLHHYSPISQLFFSISSGFFLWDLLICFRYKWGIGFKIHAAVCFGALFLTLHPFLHFQGRFFLGVFEVSTIWLHFYQLHKLFFPEGGNLQYLFAGIFALSFFLIRIVFGTLFSYNFFETCYILFQTSGEGEGLRKIHSPFAFWFYIFGNVVIMSLQYIWFVELIKEIKEVVSPSKSKQKKKD